jgi:hypothetical protein
LFGEGRSPPGALWQEPLVSSKLLEYEIWNRVHARGFGPAFGASARALIGRLRLFALTPPVLARALQPFPVPVRTLDCVHLATIEFIRGAGETVELASYGACARHPALAIMNAGQAAPGVAYRQAAGTARKPPGRAEGEGPLLRGWIGVAKLTHFPRSVLPALSCSRKTPRRPGIGGRS